MSSNIRTINNIFTPSRELVQLLQSAASDPLGNGKPFTINFRDPDYSATAGGYHPVEIRINAKAEIEYITDFCYVGLPPYEELTKCLDFDFGYKTLGSNGMVFPLESGADIFSVWETNFIAYFNSGVYEVEITRDDCG